MAVAIIVTTRVIHDRIETDPFQLHARLCGGKGLVAHVAKPTWPQIVLDAGFGNEERTTVTLVNFTYDIAQWPITGMTRFDERTAKNPLVMNVIVAPDDVE